MTARVVIHAGFHKTGTTSLQRTIHANGPKLWPHMALVMPWRMRDALRLAKAWSDRRDDATLDRFCLKMAGVLQELDPGRRPVLMSSEELCGHLPGREGVPDYGAAETLLPALVKMVGRRFPEAEVELVFTTRDITPWLASAWAEHVKASRMVWGFDEFKAGVTLESLEHAAAAIGQAVPSAQVRLIRLESHADDPLGPARAILQGMGLDDGFMDQLDAQPRANERRSDEVLAHLLEMNRSDMSREELAEAKRAYLAGLAEG